MPEHNTYSYPCDLSKSVEQRYTSSSSGTDCPVNATLSLASASPLCPNKRMACCRPSLPQRSTGGYQHGAGRANFLVLYEKGSSKDAFPYFLSDGPEVDQSVSALSVQLFCKHPNGFAQSGSPASPQAVSAAFVHMSGVLRLDAGLCKGNFARFNGLWHRHVQIPWCSLAFFVSVHQILEYC